MNVKPAIDELGAFLDRRAREFQEALIRLARAIVAKNEPRHETELESLGNLIGATMALADLHGRRRVLLETDTCRRRGAQLAADDPATPIVPHVPFEEAIDDLVSREPRLAQSAEEVRRVYRERHGFALARSADLSLTARIQEFIRKSLREGNVVASEAEQIASIGDFAYSYAETVARTNIATAYSAGRFAYAQDPDIAEIAPAFEFDAVGDADTRPSHAAADGLIAATNDPIWDEFAPPLYYNCRCSTRLVPVSELMARGLVRNGRVMTYLPKNFDAAYKGERFGHRPDRRVHGRGFFA